VHRNNAGIVHGADFLDTEEADFDRVLRANLKGTFLVGQAGSETDGGAGQGREAARRHHQYEFNQRGGGYTESGTLLRVQGRSRPTHQGHGAVACLTESA
jgi:NAD(P)-dependent dehydrogenase (short-subunit alcohol dehydrogenase family)